MSNILNMFYNLTYILIFLFSIITFCDCFEFITSALTGISISLGLAGYKFLNCNYNECCDDNWVKYNHSGLKETLEKELFGQHLVQFTILRSLEAHFQKNDPKKALVLAFHGDTGTGKNYVSQMIAKNIFKNGMKSNYVHFYSALKDFPHRQEVSKYREKLLREIEEHTSKCGKSLYIFDEVDKMAPGILDALKPYIDYHDVVGGADYRKNIFIFLSNAGSKNITEIAMMFWANGKNREQISLKDVEHLIAKGAFNEEGGLRHSEIVKRELIDIYVPFLPLEKKHVELCVQSELEKSRKNGDIKFIADQLIYIPHGVELFSTSGCKRIAKNIDLYAS